jgi:hypothetical protein
VYANLLHHCNILKLIFFLLSLSSQDHKDRLRLLYATVVELQPDEAPPKRA